MHLRRGSPGSSPGWLHVSTRSKFVLISLVALCGLAPRAPAAPAAPAEKADAPQWIKVDPLPGALERMGLAGHKGRVEALGAIPQRTQVTPHLVGFIPIPGLVTEDVDLVEVGIPGGFVPTTAVLPVEGSLQFIDELGEFVYSVIPTLSPNISGVDFVSDGAFGAFATLGYLYTFDMNPPGPPSPPALLSTTLLPGTPARRDIDPILCFGGTKVIYATGTEIHRVDVATGAIDWTTPLPTPVVEAVDPQLNAANTLLFVPTEGFMTAIDPVGGGIIATTPLLTTLVREVDARFVLGDALCYLPATGIVVIFSGATGLPLSSFPLAGPLIEGNDLEVDPSGSYGYLPTLPFMYDIDLAGMFVRATYSFAGAVHQRNQDAIFTAPGVLPVRALYATQGLVWNYDVASATLFGTAGTPGVLVDGVDPYTVDLPGGGSLALLSTMGFSHVIDLVTLATTSFPTPGVLRTDVDPKPGPVPGDKILQPAIGGVLTISSFDPDEAIVTTSAGVWTVSVLAAAVTEFIAYPAGVLTYRGGDAQPTTLLAGGDPPFSVDNPDQDFLTKCWEYKYALNRHPYWMYYDLPSVYYPHFMPYGVFGPPSSIGWDIINQCKLVMLNTNELLILNSDGFSVFQFPLPFAPIGGFVWDWDNKICKQRLVNFQEMVIDLQNFPFFVSYYITPLSGRTRWYPVVDRMNGWEFHVPYGARRLQVFNHLSGFLVADIPLPGRCIRRPVFDEQRKTLCVPLSNRRLWYFNAHRYSLGLPNATYFTAVLGSHVAAQPVFDLYNHLTIARLYGGRIAIVNTDDGLVVWDDNLPFGYYPIGPFQIDCYNKKAKAVCYDGINYAEAWIDLYPLVVAGGIPVVQILPLPGVPYGYPQFDSKDGYEFIQSGGQIIWRNLFNPFISANLVPPFPMVGQLFIDRVNKYGLVRLTGNRIYWLNLFRLTQGMPGAAQVIPLPSTPEEDIAFDTQGHVAAVHMSSGQVAMIDMMTGTLASIVAGVPRIRRQLRVHPFRQEFNYPWWDLGLGLGGEVTIDASPMRWSPPGLPMTNVVTLTPGVAPVEAQDFTPPPPIAAAMVTQQPYEFFDLAGVVHFAAPPGAFEPGATIHVVNTTKFQSPRQDDPNEDTAEFDGSAEFSVLAEDGDLICLQQFDVAGNGSPMSCLPVVLDVAGGGLPASFEFALAGPNPASGGAEFRLALPERQRVRVDIYDVSGRRLTTALDREFSAGVHPVSWDLLDSGANRVKAGVYFARVVAGPWQGDVRLVVVE